MAVFIFSISSLSDAADFGDNFYGKLNLTVGYEFNSFKKNSYNDWQTKYYSFDPSEWDCYNEGTVDNSRSQAVTIGVGYNIYYKLIDRMLDPFIGLEAQARVPFGKKINSKFYEMKYSKALGIGETYTRDAEFDFIEYARFNLKFGMKFILTSDIAFEAYGLVGTNLFVSHLKDVEVHRIGGSWNVNEVSDFSLNRKTKIGLNTGVGVNAIIKDLFLVGIEYRNGINKINFNNDKRKVQYHSIGIKLGMQI